MSPTDKPPEDEDFVRSPIPHEEDAPIPHQTIREVLENLRITQQEEARKRLLEETKLRREAKETRIKERRERQLQQVRETKAHHQVILSQSNEKVSAQVTAASRSLQAALKSTMAASLPRHSQEAREQLRVRRSIETALAALRQIGRGTFYETDVDMDLDLDTGS